MSIFDRLGTLAKDLGGAAFATPRFVWDVATSPFNDDEQFNGVKNTLVNSGAKAIGSAIKPISDIASMPVLSTALQKLDTANREVIREPLATALLVGAENPTGIENVFKKSTWQKAYDDAQHVSVGQALVGELGALKGAVTGDTADVNERVNWSDPNSVNAYFNHGPQKLWSGVGDVGIQVFGDLSIAGGKAAKMAYGASWATDALNGAGRAEKTANAIVGVQAAEDSLEVNRFTKLLQDFAKNDSTYAFNHPMLKNSPARATLAHALGQADNPKDVGLVVRAGLGDPNALESIRAVGRQDLANPIGKSLGEIDAADKWALSGKLNADGTINHAWEDPAIADEVSKEMSALTINDDGFRKFWESVDSKNLEEVAATPGGMLTRTAGVAPFQAASKFVAESRAAKFYDMRATRTGKAEVFQPTPFHRMYQIVSWPAGERPEGLVNLNDAESSREIAAVLKRATANKAAYDDQARTMLDDYMGAPTPEARAEVAYNIERTVFGQLAAKHGLTNEKANSVYDQYSRARATALSTLNKKGYTVDLDGTVFKVPFYESQTVNNLPIMDFDLIDGVLRRYNLLKPESSALQHGAGHILNRVDGTINAIDALQSMFKVGALLRLGYTMRNGIEAQLRIAASVGSTASMRHLGKGMHNMIYNGGNVAKRSIDKFNPTVKSYDFYKEQLDNTGLEIENVQSKIDSIQRKIDADRASQFGTPYENVIVGGARRPNMLKTPDRTEIVSVDNPALLADLEVFQNLLAEKQAMREATNKTLAGFEKKKRRMASGTFEHVGIDGKPYVLDEAFNGPLADIHWNNSSSENSYMSLVDSNSRILSRKMVHTGYGEVKPDAPNYWTEWSTTLNRQFGNSEVSRKLAAGENPYDVVSWLRNSKDGIALRKRLKLEASDSAEHVSIANDLLNKYLPNKDLHKMLAERTEITPEFLRSTFNETSNLPVINGHVIEENLNLVGHRKAQDIVASAFKFLGSLPEDAWARHPLYADLYRKSLKQRIDSFTAINGRPVKEIADDSVSYTEMGLAMRAAHADALRGTKEILFTLDRKTNLATYMKYLSPFFSAYENSVKTWAKLAVNKPQIINRANLIFTAPNRAGIATDSNGNPVPVDKASMNDYMWIEVPPALKKLPFGIGTGLSSLDQMGVQKKSLDVIFQGETNIPVGPYVSIPVSEIVKAQPTYEESLKWAIPFGAERNALTAMLPSWVKKQLTKGGGQDDPQYANTYTLIWQTEQMKRREKGQPPATADEIKKMADAYWNMRTVANLILPVAPQFNSPYKMYIDKWKQYKTNYPKDAQERFWKDYGDEMFQFTMSLSKNNSGMGATVNDVTNAKKYSDLVSQIGDIDPKMIGLITATGGGAYQFSDAAYKWEQSNVISSNSNLKFRGSNDPASALKENNVSLGWIKYRQVMSQIDSVMQSRGLTSLQQNGAGDLAALKKVTVSQLAKQNIDWYKAYSDPNGAKFINVRQAFDTILSNKKFMADHGNDSTWKSVSMYLQVQSEAEKILKQRKAAGKSGTIDAKANADVAYLLETTANKLKQEDIGFGDLYDRYLSYDPVFDPNLSGSAQ